MKFSTIGLEKTLSFSNFFLDYIQPKEELKPFYNRFPAIEDFGDQIKEKQFSPESREVLVTSLQRQYKSCQAHEKVSAHIEALKKDNTYTIVTGHQLNIFTGPLYFVYKIVTVINACKALKKQYPEQDFVPVYWMASEDHDFEEISYFNLFGKKYQWETEQTGAVGRFNPKELKVLIESLPEAVPLFEKAYLESENLADAVRFYINELFGEYGVVTIDGDDTNLKGAFTEVMKSDLFPNDPSLQVNETSERLTNLDYKCQIHAREINLFYLDEGIRERIIKEGDAFKVNNTELAFSESEISDLLNTNPEHFSPNVVLRPLYQETILPNLAYVGGPAEMVYWLQLKDMFDHFNTPFPILLPRNFAMVINGGLQKKMDKLGWSEEQIFKSTDDLQKEFLNKHMDDTVQVSHELEQLSKIFEVLKEKAEGIDASLTGFIGAEHNKSIKSLGNIEKRLKKSEERKHETVLNQMESLKEKLFPGGGLQERRDNFLNFYLNNPNFINELVEGFDPFLFEMHIGRF